MQAAIEREHLSLGRQLSAGVPAVEIARYAQTVAEFSAELSAGQEHLDELESQLFSRRKAATEAMREYRAVAMLIARRRAARGRRALARQGAIIDTLSLARWQAGGVR